jgi:hypothetical protein
MKVYQLAHIDELEVKEENMKFENNHNLAREDKNVFLSEYNESGIHSIPFIMKLKTNIDYDVDTLNKIYVETIGYESGKKGFDAINDGYFIGGFYMPKLKSSYVIDEEDCKKMNIDVDKLNKNKLL